ncbi:MAG TPA: PDZ domain-containing protein [Thermoguttaceae bacterium]|jgi:S1-C subfamily serine protease|nr:PDZ domain-containing protein [Thermoguttaceae bacterium]HPP51895.1 PDZ domain-containing protein [Thermoguttaceae bacterium]
MTRFVSRKSLALAVVVLAASAVAPAMAEEKAGVTPIPRLGFCSYFNGEGEYVTEVFEGSIAWEIGLEPDDVIVAVNGYRLNHDGAWYRAMRRAVLQGYARLAIVDCRTGYIVHRTVHFGHGHGPHSTP